jgi:hypothetical protein
MFISQVVVQLSIQIQVNVSGLSAYSVPKEPSGLLYMKMSRKGRWPFN